MLQFRCGSCWMVIRYATASLSLTNAVIVVCRYSGKWTN